ncbi:MAG: hypothetical protein CML20_04095 [Rheinheimera sp.]|uniref:hypothetical protein n=1 Tax=Arsukibacterium sp. UBA3155 TaxID=1946058 RepID=UPI000C931C59|nr:hypothetical protein [Arsukibacterium sp. UBA3155]MAD73970.1 hypothetical protein [Rheinheimera sp.]|tara:strand:- start:25291 stop:25989 length:699 start_codon:yes stop_codon:yes gene_type:complete
MKDLLEPFLYPQNIFLYAFLVACVFYRKKGLWLLLLGFYLAGNTYFANMVRSHYAGQIGGSSLPQSNSTYVVLGCGGSTETLPACAMARLDRLGQTLGGQTAAVIITTRHCQPYQDYLLNQQSQPLVVDCFDAGDNTYQEFSQLSRRLGKQQRLQVVTSDFHGWRVTKLIGYHQLNAGLTTVSSQTFRPLNCHLNCMFTVNLSNYDLYSKLIAEYASYLVWRVSVSAGIWQS